MSGGSWDYFSYKLDEVVARLAESKCAHRRALAEKLRLVPEALHCIEWVDSGDRGQGDELDSIRAALGEYAPVMVLNEVIKVAELEHANLADAIATARKAAK